MMKEKVFFCNCYSYEHQFRVTVFNENEDETNETSFEFIIPYENFSFFERLKKVFAYLFNKKVIYKGETLLHEKQVEDLISFLKENKKSNFIKKLKKESKEVNKKTKMPKLKYTFVKKK